MIENPGKDESWKSWEVTDVQRLFHVWRFLYGFDPDLISWDPLHPAQHSPGIHILTFRSLHLWAVSDYFPVSRSYVERAGERILIWLEESVKIPGALLWRQVIAGQVGARLAKWVPDLRADALQSIVGPDSMWEEAPLSGRRGERY